tara:strand:- start:1752 stop:2189 length:438 start_codon:yes stop_codon:yes gene_type:complete
MKDTLLWLLFLIVTISANAQYKERHFSTKVEYAYQGSSYLSLGIGKVKRVEPHFSDTLTYFKNSHGPSFNVDFRLHENFNIAPGLSYEYSKNFFTVKLKGGVLTDFKTQDYFISPQAGLSVLGALYVLYGYNFQLITNSTLTAVC